MTSWRIAIALLFITACCLLSPSAHAQSLTLEGFVCVPDTCKDIDFGFLGNSAAQVVVGGLCTNGFEPSTFVRVTAEGCSFPVETEAEGGGDNTLQDDGCGDLVLVGEVFANGSAFNALTQIRVAFVGASMDCTGLEGGSPAVQAC